MQHSLLMSSGPTSHHDTIDHKDAIVLNNPIVLNDPNEGSLDARLLRLADVGLIRRNGPQWFQVETDSLVAYVLLQLAGLTGNDLEATWATYVAVPLLDVLRSTDRSTSP
jgi:hypothetical protein